MIIFGSRATTIGSMEMPDSDCKYCNQMNTQKLTVFGKYLHVFWIPIFPIGKVAVAECTHCKRTIEEKEFSNELKHQYWDIRSQIKTPKWHFTGLFIIGFIILLVAIVGGGSKNDDPRKELLNNDVKSMSGSPSKEQDSISLRIKLFMEMSVTDEMEPESFEYLTKIKDDKALILVKIPKIKNVEKKERTQVFEIINSALNSIEALKDKEKYIGIHGKYNFILIKTPFEEDNSKFALSDPLYDFYGPKPLNK